MKDLIDYTQNIDEGIAKDLIKGLGKHLHTIKNKFLSPAKWIEQKTKDLAEKASQKSDKEISNVIKTHRTKLFNFVDDIPEGKPYKGMPAEMVSAIIEYITLPGISNYIDYSRVDAEDIFNAISSEYEKYKYSFEQEEIENKNN